VTTLTLTLERPCSQAVGCRHEDEASVVERWQFVRQWRMGGFGRCRCCSGPTVNDTCPVCTHGLVDEFVDTLFDEMEVGQ
jgi:hypothetical protein